MDAEIKQEFNNLKDFLRENMVTKEEFTDFNKENSAKLSALTESINKLTTAVDNLAKRINDFDQEHKALKHQVSVMQDWIREASKKVGIEFKL